MWIGFLPKDPIVFIALEKEKTKKKSLKTKKMK